MIRIRAQHLLKLISDAYPGLVTYIDHNYRFQFANQHYHCWFGVDPSSMLDKTVEEVIGSDFFLSRKVYMDHALNGEKVRFNAVSYHKTLGQREIEQIYDPDFDEDGNVVGFIAMAYDITEQKKLEKVAQENEARFRSLTEVMPQLVWIADADGGMIFFNHNWPRYTNTSMEENLGHGWINVIHHEDRVSVLLTWKDALKTGGVFEAEYRLRMADGKYRWHMARGIPIKNEQGQTQRWVGTTTDIEAQKNAKDLAVAERKRIYSLFMQSPVVILVLNGADHHVELINPAGQKFVAGQDITGLSLRESFPELEEQGFLSVLDEIYYSGYGRQFKAKSILLSNGNGNIEEHFFDLFYEPIKDENNLTTGILNMAVDVTEEVKALKRAEESEELFRTYAESMPQMAFITDADGLPTYFNQRWYDFTGLDFETSRLNPSQYLLKEESEKTIKKWLHSIETGEPYQNETRIRRADGTFRWNLGRAVPLRDSKGSITQWVGTYTDIHAQKEIESEQARLLQVLESSSDFIGMADPNGKGIYVNTAGREMLGIERPGSSKIIDLFFPEDVPYVENVILPTTLSEGKWVGDFRFRHVKTGEERWVHYNSFVTHDEKTGEVTGFATVSRDLTEMKQKERKLEEALIARDQFLSIASHELKTPLTSLKLQAQLTLRSLQLGKEIPVERQMTMANQTSDMVGRLTRLIDDMLDVSRIRTGKLKLDKSKQELGDIVREVVLRMSLLFEAAGLNLPSVEATAKLYGEWDRFRLEQVIGNLLTNAIRYGQGRSIEIKLNRNKDKGLLSVTDHGYGIAEKDLKRIFGRFERAINSSEVSGLGLGLFISKEIVETQHGTIWVESEIGKGSTFFVELPLIEGSK